MFMRMLRFLALLTSLYLSSVQQDKVMLDWELFRLFQAENISFICVQLAISFNV